MGERSPSREKVGIGKRDGDSVGTQGRRSQKESGKHRIGTKEN